MTIATRTAAPVCFKLHRRPTPAAPTGLFSVATIKKGEPVVDLYRFTEDGRPDGRLFYIKKTECDTEQDDAYALFLAHNGQDHSCSCKAGEWRPNQPCRHYRSIRQFIDADQLQG